MTFKLGVGVASSHQIGKYLGVGNGHFAKLFCFVPYMLALTLGSVEMCAILAVRKYYGYLFTDDTQVNEVTASVLVLIAGFQFLELANGGAAGILRGVWNCLAYYGVGITMAWVLCYQRGLGLVGLWAGLILGSVSLLVLQTVSVSLVNWKLEIERIGNRFDTVSDNNA
jgi:MATE family multidrug resistance protein